jgi:hypothetical protein
VRPLARLGVFLFFFFSVYFPTYSRWFVTHDPVAASSSDRTVTTGFYTSILPRDRGPATETVVGRSPAGTIRAPAARAWADAAPYSILAPYALPFPFPIQCRNDSVAFIQQTFSLRSGL